MAKQSKVTLVNGGIVEYDCEAVEGLCPKCGEEVDLCGEWQWDSGLFHFGSCRKCNLHFSVTPLLGKVEVDTLGDDEEKEGDDDAD